MCGYLSLLLACTISCFVYAADQSNTGTIKKDWITVSVLDSLYGITGTTRTVQVPVHKDNSTVEDVVRYIERGYGNRPVLVQDLAKNGYSNLSSVLLKECAIQFNQGIALYAYVAPGYLMDR